MARQDADSVTLNAEFFARDTHGRDVAELDTYLQIGAALNRELAGVDRLLDVGNGGVFEYDTAWFYPVEKLLFRPLVLFARTPLLGGHPAVIQLPFDTLVGLVAERLDIVSAYQVPIGRWITQFGRRWPTALTPARAYLVVGRKRDRGRDGAK